MSETESARSGAIMSGMTDAPPPAMDLLLPAPLRRARGVAMTAGIVMTPLMILAGISADRGALLTARQSTGVAQTELRPTIAPDESQR